MGTTQKYCHIRNKYTGIPSLWPLLETCMHGIVGVVEILMGEVAIFRLPSLEVYDATKCSPSESKSKLHLGLVQLCNINNQQLCDVTYTRTIHRKQKELQLT